MPWLQAHLVVEKEMTARIEYLFQELGAISITLGDAADEALLEPDPGEAPLWQRTRVTALFDPDCQVAGLRRAVEQSLPGDSGANLQLEILQDQVWERTWLDDFEPMRFGNRLWVCPDGQRPANAGGIIIDLDPGLAFGTGTHPTTALCLEWLDRHPPKDQKVVDYGCGSGILAIAALKLGARTVAAVDHDYQALEATRENARKNGVASRLQVFHSTAVPRLIGDLLLANILAGTLVDLETELALAVRSGGTAVLSGILSNQAEQVATAFRRDFDVFAPTLLGDWLLLEARRY